MQTRVLRDYSAIQCSPTLLLFALLVCFLFASRKSTRSSKKEGNRQIEPPTVPIFMGVTGAIDGVLFPFRIGVASFSFPAPLDAPPNPPEGCATPAQTRKPDDEARIFNWAPPAAPAALRPIFPTSNACTTLCGLRSRFDQGWWP
jgi:hypothetical protein